MNNNDNFVVKKVSKLRNNTVLHLRYKDQEKKSATIDEILDKINEKGIHSLTKEEQKSLDEYSKN